MKRKTFSFHEKLVLLMVVILVTFASCSKTGGIGGGTIPPPTPPPPPPKPGPTLSITVEKTVVEYGDSVKVSWVASANSENIVVEGVLRTSLTGYFYAKNLVSPSVTFSGTVTTTGYPPVTSTATVTVTPMSPEMQKLTLAPWKWTKEEIKPLGASNWTELTLAPCYMDDWHIFTVAKRYIWNRITVKCSPDEEDFEGNWKLIEGNTKLIRGDTMSITINENTMVLEHEKPDLISGIPTKMRHTFTR